MHEALMKCQNTIDRFGGHAMAIGITIKRIFTNLESIGVLLKKDNENKFDRTLNVTIDFERLNEIVFNKK